MIDNLVEQMLKPINYTVGILLGIFTVLWGAWLASPFWDVLSHSETYSFMAAFGPNSISPEVFWGLVAIVCGLITIWGVMRHSYTSLTWGSMIMAWHWLMIAMFYFVGDWTDLSGIMALCFAVYALFIYLNIKINYRDTKHIDE